jgi:alcohol dehydrogenase class IV
MQYAAYYGGIAFTRAYVGNVHALAHKLGGKYNTPHGLANAVLLPYVLDYYGKTAEEPLAELATAVGIKGVDNAAKARLFIAAIRKMNEVMNIPATLDGIKEEDLDFLANEAFKEANPAYPVPKIMSKEDMKEIYRKVGGLK